MDVPKKETMAEMSLQNIQSGTEKESLWHRGPFACEEGETPCECNHGKCSNKDTVEDSSDATPDA
jgi:hypothetical protein